MDFKFIFAPLPMILLFSYIWIAYPHYADYDFHARYEGENGGYPSGVAFLLSLIPLSRQFALYVFGLFVAIVLPYILVFEITKNKIASWLYIYGSNIPIVVYLLWFMPQATIHLFMLISVLCPPFLVVFLIIGKLFHGSWFFAWALTATYILLRRLKWI